MTKYTKVGYDRTAHEAQARQIIHTSFYHRDGGCYCPACRAEGMDTGPWIEMLLVPDDDPPDEPTDSADVDRTQGSRA